VLILPILPLNTTDEPLADCSDSKSTEKIYVVDHPLGRGLSFSLADNLVVDHDFVSPSDPDPDYQRIHYGAPTERGNSGGPVLDEHNFEVIGVHRAIATNPLRKRADIDLYNANEAVAMRSVLLKLI
jgi:S1-C subfamily serine protease